MYDSAGSHAEHVEWLCTRLMEAEVDQQLGAEKSQRTDGRSGHRRGHRPRRLDTRMGTMYLMVPKVRQGGYIPFFVTERKRSEAALRLSKKWLFHFFDSLKAPPTWRCLRTSEDLCCVAGHSCQFFRIRFPGKSGTF